jgi:hypothetical protein
MSVRFRPPAPEKSSIIKGSCESKTLDCLDSLTGFGRFSPFFAHAPATWRLFGHAGPFSGFLSKRFSIDREDRLLQKSTRASHNSTLIASEMPLSSSARRSARLRNSSRHGARTWGMRLVRHSSFESNFGCGPSPHWDFLAVQTQGVQAARAQLEEGEAFAFEAPRNLLISLD